jgi:hypothetical protein
VMTGDSAVITANLLSPSGYQGLHMVQDAP